MTNPWARLLDVSVWTAVLLAALGAVEGSRWGTALAVTVVGLGAYLLLYRQQRRMDARQRDRAQLDEAAAQAWRQGWQPSPAPPAEPHRQRRVTPRGDATFLLDAQERMLAEISGALHGDVAQVLTALRLDLELHRGGIPGGAPVADPPLPREAIAHVDRCLARIRRLVLEIHPPVLDDWGLVPALWPLLADFEHRTGIPCSRELPTAFSAAVLAPLGTSQGYRIAQGVLDNIERHAAATRVRVTVGEDDADLLIEIEDDGVGFDPAALPAGGTHGLAVMAARAEAAGGTLRVRSRPGEGTRIQLRLPRRATHDTSFMGSTGPRSTTPRQAGSAGEVQQSQDARYPRRVPPSDPAPGGRRRGVPDEEDPARPFDPPANPDGVGQPAAVGLSQAGPPRGLPGTGGVPGRHGARRGA